MSSERFEQVKTILVGALMVVAFTVIGPPAQAPDAATPELALVDHSPATDGEFLAQLISE